MKFLGVIAVYLAIAFVLGWGILLAVNGSFWLLGFSVAAYLFAFAKLGCLPPTESH